jgi:TBC1 domain family member 8/9
MLLNVIIPLRDVSVIENAASHSPSEKAILFTTKQKSSFLFMQVEDRNFLVNKLSELLSKTTTNRRLT